MNTLKNCLKQSLLALAILCTVSLANAQTASKLEQIKREVQFEIARKQENKSLAAKLEDRYNTLAKMRIEDEQILQVFKLIDDIQALTQVISDANARQAILAENIKALSNAQGLSQQEYQEYKQCELALTEVANAQNKIVATAANQRKIMEAFLNRLPPPAELTLANNLNCKLIVGENGQRFYVSQLIETRHVDGTSQQPSKKLNPNRYDAAKLAITIGQREAVRFALPTQQQLEVIAKTNIFPELAVWSADTFPLKNQLASTRRRKSNTPVARQQLTPTQIDAAARFKIPFFIVWDPKQLLGYDAFVRELPQASYEQLGVILVAPASIGSAKRLQYLQDVYRKQSNAQPQK